MAIIIIDYGIGNLYSVANAIKKVTKEKVYITNDAKKIKLSNRIILPGQGAIKDCIKELKKKELYWLLKEIINTTNKPVLGICIGQHLLMESSEENKGVFGINYIKGIVKNYKNKNFKIPHTGWNIVYKHKEHQIWNGIKSGSRFYFVHSFYVKTRFKNNVLGVTEYGGKCANVITYYNSVITVQFHPEKSSSLGLKFLKNFINWLP
ncbi:imidazole glycerol phosphate synthase subunit HisH [Candidatus Portiera aleyrodidarum]|uniref:Imidazole glycerol phosphate synthase subunit HisH n=1 Tax=Candidatus Portiera aleyrodidarum MED (Bemisia tabaci) TaxID=1163752 RepID=A0AAU8RPL9_9GAMM|nr:imidazole glycerol phosphate synthase subunit HisH [Candidatus Portiera aleyrodidarum]AFQ24217.1 imidazole glycerol phosphate synthase, glutamine amidotransferase subunit [Candidatus Portiera aleyrodidarum BT-B-HRs]AFS18972.1 Imidazole glycerol phosphate synthase subunit hisH [Candidatus Portiera aleyrodidarum BT-QVLC]AFT80632.1 Imidazole glycerol phosphate synthase amidotransferase subunit [Candidatus Portiera aleyrodidarum BT-QVLC]AFT80905.1 Imidazole glycerol phosphate synthase amidotrans